MTYVPGPEDRQNHYLRANRVVLISDGCFAAVRLPPHIEWVKVGSALENMGIVAADMCYLPNGTDRLAFFCQVASSFSKPREVDLTVARLDEHGNEQLAKVIPLEVKPGTNRPETFILENALPGRWIARLNVEDPLPLDNVAYLVAARPEAIRVAVRSEDRYFLEKSVLAFSQIAGLLTLVADKADVVLASAAGAAGRQAALAASPGNIVLVGRRGRNCRSRRATRVGEEPSLAAASRRDLHSLRRGPSAEGSAGRKSWSPTTMACP